MIELPKPNGVLLVGRLVWGSHPTVFRPYTLFWAKTIFGEAHGPHEFQRMELWSLICKASASPTVLALPSLKFELVLNVHFCIQHCTLFLKTLSAKHLFQTQQKGWF